MIGIIYKFTIIAKYKYDGHKPFYIGQHVGVNDFNDYWGSGTIWNNFIDRLKKDYPKCWMKLIRREVLYIHECSQKALDKLEEYYIKKEQAHYSYKQGGCNVLWGTANKFGSGSPMKDEGVRKQRSEHMKQYYKTHKHPTLGRKASEHSRKLLSKSHIGKKLSLSTIEKIRSKNLGKKRSDEFSEKMRETWNKRKESGWTSPLRGTRVSEEIRIKRAIGVKNFYSNHKSNFWGKKHTEEAKYKISQKMLGKYKGRKMTEETKKKMSESAKMGWIKRKQSLFNKK